MAGEKRRTALDVPEKHPFGAGGGGGNQPRIPTPTGVDVLAGSGDKCVFLLQVTKWEKEILQKR